MRQNIMRFVRGEDGATAIEYALIAALASIMAITAMQAVGNNMVDMYTLISTTMADAAAGSASGGAGS